MIVGRNSERGEATRAAVASGNSCEVTFLAADATTVEGAARIAAEAEKQLGGVDILVCTTAADVQPELFANIPTDDISRTFTQLALPSMYMASEILPHMSRRKTGVIINVASDAGKTATPGEAVIGAAKAAIVMFTRTLAIEAKRSGIRVNVLTPSLVNGTGSTERITSAGFSAKLFAKSRDPSASRGSRIRGYRCPRGVSCLTRRSTPDRPGNKRQWWNLRSLRDLSQSGSDATVVRRTIPRLHSAVKSQIDRNLKWYIRSDR